MLTTFNAILRLFWKKFGFHDSWRIESTCQFSGKFINLYNQFRTLLNVGGPFLGGWTNSSNDPYMPILSQFLENFEHVWLRPILGGWEKSSNNAFQGGKSTFTCFMLIFVRFLSPVYIYDLILIQILLVKSALKLKFLMLSGNENKTKITHLNTHQKHQIYISKRLRHAINV